MLELHMVKIDQEVVLWPWHEKVPGSSSMVVLQDRAVIVQHCLWKQQRQLKVQKPFSERKTTMQKWEWHRHDTWGRFWLVICLFGFFLKNFSRFEDVILAGLIADTWTVVMVKIYWKIDLKNLGLSCSRVFSSWLNCIICQEIILFQATN